MLYDFGYGGEIGDWSVVRKVFFVQRGFLEKESDNRLFQLRGKLTSSKTQVDYASDDGGKDTGEVMLGGFRDHTVCWDDQESV